MAKLRLRREPARIQIAENIRLSESNHEKLLKYIKRRLDYGNDGRDIRIQRYKFIDREVSGYMVLSDDDKKRMLDNIKGKGPKTTDFILELTGPHLDEFVTFLTSVLAAEEGIYSAVGAQHQQEYVNGFSVVMQKHAADFKHFTNLVKSFFDMGKYNFGGWTNEWAQIYGNKIGNTPTRNTVEIIREVVKAGNTLQSIDPYNFIYDISVPASDVYQNGEFFAIPTLETPFRVRRMIANKEIYSAERYYDAAETKFNVNNYNVKYYEAKPTLVWHGVFADGVQTDWHSVLSGNEHPTVGEKIEFIHYWGWLNPKDFGLSDDDELQIWRITIAGCEYITHAEHLTNAHGYLPCAIGMPRTDGFDTATKTFAETFAPLQRFASNEINVRQKAARKKLYGLTIYDAQFAPLMEKADLLGGKVPWRPSGTDRDIRKSFLQLNDVPHTDDTMQNVEAVVNLMQKILPTDILKQVAELERATIYQAASVVQGGNRRLFKYARIINDQAFTPIKFMMMYNILQFMESMTIIDNETGQPKQINPQELRDADLEYIIASGIKGMDKLIVVEMLRDVINMILQSANAIQQIDIIGVIDYWTNLIGEKVDFKSFRIQSPLDQLTPEQKQQAFQLFQQAQQQGPQRPGPAPGNGAAGPIQLPPPGAGAGAPR